MKTAKSYKIVLLLLAFIMSITAGIFLANKPITTKADVPSVSSYFKVTGSASSSVTAKDNAVVFNVKKGDKVSISNELVLNGLELSLSVPDGVTVSFEVSADSFDVNGNYNSNENTFDKRVTSKFIDNGFDGTVKLSIENNLIKLSNFELDIEDGLTEDYYKVSARRDITTGKVAFTVDAEDEDFKEVKLNYVDYNSDDVSGKCKQEFNADDFKYAVPRIALNESFYNFVDGVNTVRLGYEYTLTVTSYSLFKKTETLYLKSDNENVSITTESGKNINFTKIEDGVTFNVGVKDGEDFKIYETFTVNVKTEGKNGEGVAPEYTFSNEALQSFKKALEEAVYSGDNYIAIGSGKYLEIPSMKALVSDNLFPYEDLKYVVYYTNNNTSSSYSSALKVPVEKVGKYTFYVLFKDAYGNTMETKDFEEGGKYEQYVFSFELYDDAPLSVIAPEPENGEYFTGYVNSVFNGEEFDITAYSYKTTYTLSYKTVVDGAEVWQEIIKASTAKKENFTEDSYFTYEEIIDFNFDGGLSFKPIKTGMYKIKCVVDSTSAIRSKDAEYLIKIDEVRKTVTPDDHWFQNHALSVVFLIIGVLCLIGIIIILCIKPKDVNTKSKD